MNEIFLLILTTLPSILICMGFYYLDKEKESLRLLLKLFLAGVLAPVLVFLISSIIESIFPSFFVDSTKINMFSSFQIVIYTFLIIALVEEGCKFIFVKYFSKKGKEFDEAFDGVMYAVAVSTGFALFENILYVLLGGNKVALLRAVTASPAHIIFAIYMGFFLGLAKYQKRGLKKRICSYSSLIVPVFLHGLYDYIVLTKGTFTYIIVFELIFLLISIVCLIYLKKIGKIDILLKDKYCLRCGDKTNKNVCNRCGNLVS